LDFVAREEPQTLDPVRSQLLNDKYSAIVKNLANDAVIIAATLTTLGHEDLAWLQCKVVVFAEAPQCYEGEVSIAMKLQDLRAVILCWPEIVCYDLLFTTPFRLVVITPFCTRGRVIILVGDHFANPATIGFGAGEQ
jgi:hypothetical protein